MLCTDLETAYASERELREQNQEVINSQRKLVQFIVHTDTVREYQRRLEKAAQDPHSTPLLTKSTNRWGVPITTPIRNKGKLLGVVGVFLYIERPPADK